MRCVMVEQLENAQLGELFKQLNLENRTQLITMVNDETREILESELDNKGRQELFFYEHFTMRERTNYKPSEFVEKMLQSHYDQNN